MKPIFGARVFAYVFVRVLLSSVIVYLFTVGTSMLLSDMALVVIIGGTFAVAMCSFTAVIIARHVRDLVVTPLNRIHESANMLMESSMSVNKAAKDMSYAMHDIVCLFDKAADAADACEAAGSDENNSKSA
ncbi:MAG: hypothetical protein FWB97_06840 [Oscillospiraceae bacterium]|nr:hypothetical protein [Oscillospiraceae bacterium]